MNKYAAIYSSIVLLHPELSESDFYYLYSLVDYRCAADGFIKIERILQDNSDGFLKTNMFIDPSIFTNNATTNDGDFIELPDDDSALLWFALKYGG